MSSPIRNAETVSTSPQIQPLTRASVNECATSRSRAASIVRSGDFSGLDGVEVARAHHRADADQRVGLQEAERARNMPPRVIRVPHDIALGGEANVLALQRMAERNVRALFRQPAREAHMRTVDRVAQAGIARARRVLG